MKKCEVWPVFRDASRYSDGMLRPDHVPAAHSTDSEWFAVDESGEVARFETGEPGGFPSETGLSGGEAQGVEDAYALFYLQALGLARHLDSQPTESLPEVRPVSKGYQLVAFDDLSAPLSQWDLLEIHRGRRLWAITTQRLAQQLATDLAVKAQIALSHDDELFFEEGEHGITVYSADDYDAPGLYTRASRPDVAVLASQLPDDVRQKVSKLKLPVRFAESESIQLADHPEVGDVMVWGDLPLRGEAAPVEPLPSGQHQTPSLKRVALIFVVGFIVLFAIWALGHR